jgi:hypothetical protein
MKFNSLQIEDIINKTVDLIAADEDKEFFKGVLRIKADEAKSSAEFSNFITKLLNN